MSVLGAILAGGRAQRFGSNKALALYRGEPLIAHAARSLGAQVDALVVCGGEPMLPGPLRLPDLPGPGLGPLGGLAAALRHARAHGFDGAVTAGCDTPAIPTGAVAALRAAGGPAYVDGMPLIGWWPSALDEAVLRFLQVDERRSIRGWAASVGAVAVPLSRPVPNVNTPADLEALALSGDPPA